MNLQLHSRDLPRRTVRETTPANDGCDDAAGAILHALWVGEHAAVYLARAIKAIVVHHGAAPSSNTEFNRITDVVIQTCLDLEIRTVLIDFRIAPSRCDCRLCESQGFPEFAVIAAAQELDAYELSRGLRRFSTFESAIRFVRPKSIEPNSAPCPWGFERIISAIQEQGGIFVLGNYAAAVFELPRNKAVYVHWSGDLSDKGAVYRVLSTVDTTISRTGATHLILDHRNRVDLPAELSKNLRAPSLSPALRRVTHAISIGEWPRNQGSLEDKFHPAVGSRWRISSVHTLKEALSLTRTSKPARRDKHMKQAA